MLEGFLKALCAMSNNCYQEGGLAYAIKTVTEVPESQSTTKNNVLLEEFFDYAILYEKGRGGHVNSIIPALREVIKTQYKCGIRCVDLKCGSSESFLDIWFGRKPNFVNINLFWSYD